MERKGKIMAAIMLAGSLAIAGTAMGEHGEEHENGNIFRRRLDVAPMANEAYKKECGSCHLAYQPGLLPARSWQKIMGTLDRHFGDNAELAPEDNKAIADYLSKNSADGSNYKASVKIANSIPSGETPVAISRTAYFVHKHREIPDRMVKGNPLVMSFSHCGRCHQNAAAGSFGEHEVNIPGYGKFED